VPVRFVRSRKAGRAGPWAVPVTVRVVGGGREGRKEKEEGRKRFLGCLVLSLLTPQTRTSLPTLTAKIEEEEEKGEKKGRELLFFPHLPLHSLRVSSSFHWSPLFLGRMGGGGRNTI